MATTPVDLPDLMAIARRAATREGLPPCDAEDVASIALLQYLKVAPTVNHPVTWIFLVARRNAWLLRRRERRHIADRRSEGDTEHASSHFDTMEAQLDLRAALAALTPIERSALLFRYVEGRCVDTIAEKLGLSPTTVKRRLKSGRESLLRALSGRSMRRYLHCADLGAIEH